MRFSLISIQAGLKQVSNKSKNRGNSKADVPNMIKAILDYVVLPTGKSTEE